jgi:hypothetical protein
VSLFHGVNALAAPILSMLLAGAVFAQDIPGPAVPDQEYCSRRDADPRKCLIQDGPPNPNIIRKPPPRPPSPPPPAPPPGSQTKKMTAPIKP